MISDRHKAAGRGWIAGSRLTVTRVAAAAVGAACVVALSLFGSAIVEELRSLRATSRDNVQWTLAQFEVDYWTMLNALQAAGPADASSLQGLRRRFDIFFSRAETIGHGSMFAPVLDAEVPAKRLAKVREALRASLPAIDGGDAALAAALPDLTTRFHAVGSDIRTVSLAGIEHFAAVSDRRRTEFAGLLLRTASIACGLIALLAITLVALWRQQRIATRHARDVRLGADRLATTISASPGAVVMTHADGAIVEFNPAAADVFALSRSDALGRDLAAFFALAGPLEEASLSGRPVDAAAATMGTTGLGSIAGKGPLQRDARRSDGTTFPAEISVAAVRGSDGPMFVAYFHDITDRLAAERELTEARDKALAAARARSQFLAVMSHEMRTPLNGVLAVLDLMGGTELTPLQRRYVETAMRSGEILQHHIDDVLDVTRIESGRFTLACRPFLLADLVEEIERIHQPLAEARGNRLGTQLALPPEPAHGDRHRLGQILLNLVGNAIKFTDHGEITLSARVVGEGDEVEISVSDTGIGIAPEDRERIFEDFVTLDPSYQRTVSGYGLGLSICRRIAQAMGGDIRVDSTLGRGSTFTLAIPLRFAPGDVEPVADAGPRASCHPVAEGLRVLVVEDNETNRFAAREMLEREGCHVSEAEDGLAGLARAERERFDLVLMDISMPHLDGIETTRRIRAGAGASAAAPIVGLTAHAMPEEQARLRAAGMQDCLLKPLRTKHLRPLLAMFAGRRDEPPQPAPARGPKPAGDAPAAIRASGGLDAAVLDREVVTELREMLPPETLAARVGAFGAEIAATAAEMRREAAGGDLATLGRLAHRAAGSSSVFGLVALRDILGALEEVCADGEGEFVDALLDELDAEIPGGLAALGRALGVPA